MIVLNTTDKLQIKTSGSTITSMTIVVSYWSVDTTNVWTPARFTGTLGPITGAPTTILAAPGGSEVNRVVENIWINVLTGFSGGDLDILMDTSGTGRVIMHHTGTLPGDTVILLDRNGMFSITPST